MCLAVPAKVISIEGSIAKIDIMGNTASADISLIEHVDIGEYVIVHAGFAIQKYDEEEALATLALIGEMMEKNGSAS
jgi:hydrogenase expression/formation protein HypC